MSTTESQNIEQATSAIAYEHQPDQKTRRYDRQLRLWAASGQAALESSRILVISASATSTSVLKNLVLPGIGHFTILDPSEVKHSDAGNNFFLNGFSSIGKSRAEEAVPLLTELNDSVQGQARVESIESVLETESGRTWIKSFSLVIAHNLHNDTLQKLSQLLWQSLTDPPLIIVRSAGFLADFFIQFREQCIIEPHSEALPSLRLTQPFPALEEWADSLDYSTLDPTDHAHIPFIVILVKEAKKWRAEHDGNLPKTYAEKQAFKAQIRSLQGKLDEENFEEAENHSWRIWSDTGIPYEIKALFDLQPLDSSTSASQSNGNENQSTAAFHALLDTLKKYVEESRPLPLTSTLPDMHTDTESYVKVQKLYKEQAGEEAALFKTLLKQNYPDAHLDEAMVDLFIKNVHHVRVLRGKQWGEWETSKEAIAESLAAMPKETVTHLALSALSRGLASGQDITEEFLKADIQNTVGPGVELPDEVDNAVGELVRAPDADLPNVAAFLGGMIAQETIKMITKQYVPVKGYCVVDLVDTWTGTIGA